jgi:hypothetical protein
MYSYSPPLNDLIALDPVAMTLTATTDTATLTNGNNNPITVTLADVATQAKGTMSVEVSNPFLTLSGQGLTQTPTPATGTQLSASLVAGMGYVTLSLTDKGGNGLTLPAAGVKWSSTDSAGASLQLVGTGTGAVATWNSPAGSVPGTVTIGVTGPDGTPWAGTAVITVQSASQAGVCAPSAGATTCSVTLYNIDSGVTTEAAIAAPVLATTTTVTVYNGTTTSQTMAQPLGAALYETVPGVCDPRNPGCPNLISHNAKLCAVDGKWTPVTYSYIISTEYTSSGCTGVGLHSDITGGFTLSASGQLIATGELKQHGSTTCNNGAGLITVFSGTYDNLQTVNLDLSNGAGNASLARNDQEDSTNNNTPPGMLHQTVTGSGSVTWPAESASLPQFPNTGIAATTTPWMAGQALPSSCIAAASQTNAVLNQSSIAKRVLDLHTH